MSKLYKIITDIKKLEDELEKSWKKAQIGEIRTRQDGKKYKKVSDTGNTSKDWQLVTQDKSKQDRSDKSPKQGGNGTFEGKKKLSNKELSEAAKNASETALNNAIKQSGDPLVRETAHQELKRREEEEKPQEEQSDQPSVETETKPPDKKAASDYDKEIEELENKIRELRSTDIDYSDVKAMDENTKQIQQAIKDRQRLVQERDSLRKVPFEEYMKGFKNFDKTGEYFSKLEEHQNKFKLSNLKGLSKEEREKVFDEEEKSQRELDILKEQIKNAQKEAEKYYEEKLMSLDFTDEEDNSLNDYMKNSFSDIRTHLVNGERDEELDADIENISSFIQKNKIDENLVLNRRVTGKGVEFFQSLKKGDIYEDKSFSSTSLKELTHFGDFNISILAKKGSSVANINNPGELEYLVDKGSKFRVLDKNENGIIVELL